MALKATIFKVSVQLSDIDRHYYDALQLTIARHPSETDERMMVRLLAFVINAHEHLQMTKGLSSDEQPDIWQINLSGEIDLWIELGLPDEKRIRKAFSQSKKVQIFSYGAGNAEVWWQKNQAKLSQYKNLSVFYVTPEDVGQMTQLVNRTMELQCTISQGQVWLTDDTHAIEVTPHLYQQTQ